MKFLFNKLINLSMPILMMWVGARLFFWGVREDALSRESRRWPSVPGQVVRSRVCVSQGTKHTKYWPAVDYQYVVGRNFFEGDRIQFGPSGAGRRDDAFTTISRYPVGSTVPVYFDPKAPEISCLDNRAFEKATYISIVLGGWIFLVGSAVFIGPIFWNLILISVRRDARKRREKWAREG